MALWAAAKALAQQSTELPIDTVPFKTVSESDRPPTMVLYESAARPGELLTRNIVDFTSNEKGDFIFLEGEKGTPDRTNQLVRSGRTIRE